MFRFLPRSSRREMKNPFLNFEREFADPDEALFHIVPIPYAGSDPSCKGMELGAEAILAASARLPRVDSSSRRSLTRFGVYTQEPIPIEVNAREQTAAIEKAAIERELFRPRRFPIALGGSRSISGPLIRAAADIYGELSVLQFSARAALRDSYGEDGKDSHESVMARALEAASEVALVGTRSFSEEELERFPELIDAAVAPEQIEDDFDRVVETILWKTGVNVYITFDMDAFDPSAAPGVGTPEPGGLTWRQAVRLLEAVVAGKSVVGFDVAGVKPLGGNNVVTEFTAARLVCKIINAVSQKKGGF